MISDVYKVIGNMEEIAFFYNYGLPKLKNNECYFLSVSYRNKDLTEEERKYYGLGRSEMCDAEALRHDTFESLIQQLRRWEYPFSGAIGKNGIPKPQKARRIYINITPIDMLSSSRDLISEISKFHDGLLDSYRKGSEGGQEENWYGLKKIMASPRSIYARNFGTKEWLDFDADFDTSDPQLVKKTMKMITNNLNNNFKTGNVMAVSSIGGAHWLIRKSVFKINPSIISGLISDLLFGGMGQHPKEVCLNKNQMMCLPGTYIGENFIPQVMNKGDFADVIPFHAYETGF